MTTLKDVLDQVTQQRAQRQSGRPRTECLPGPIGCGGPITEFADEVARREFEISGLCQACQDRIFAEDEEEEF